MTVLPARSRHAVPPLSSVLALAAAAALGACGGGSDDSADGGAAEGPDGAGEGGSVIGPIGGGGGQAGDAALPGDIERYGVITVEDQHGRASGAVAGFFALSSGVGPAAFGGALDPDASECRVVPAGGDVGFEALSAGFLPSPAGVVRTPIDAGETVALARADGSAWLELEPMDFGGTRLYDPATALPDGEVPEGLVANVPGGAFPAFTGETLPGAEPLVGFDDGEGDTIGPDTRFAWRAGDVDGAKIRLSYVTRAGFFADDGGVTLTCTVPDTGEFAFSEETRRALGEGFEGERFVVSRVAIDTAVEGDALLVLVRESETVD